LTALALDHPIFRAAHHAAVVVADSPREALLVTGRDARNWLNGLVTCDLTGLDARRGAYGLLLTKQGKIQTDLDVIVGSSGLVLSVGPGAAEPIRSVLDHYLVMEEAELVPRPEVGFLRLIGPRVSGLLDPLAAHPAVLAVGVIDWLGLGGAVVAVERGAFDEVTFRALEGAGAGARRAALAEWDALRISRAFPRIGCDYGSEDNPHEAALDKLAVSFSKGCYLGQEVVCMQDMRGRVKRRLIPLELAPGAHVDVGAEVHAAGAPDAVGRITSLARAGSALVAFARVRAPFFENDAALEAGGVPAERIQSAPERLSQLSQ
jgi:folate-binding protein YgfZ